MERAHTHTGCWNCKSLKIGCDQGFPACQNCLQSNKNCLGYGLRLSWPRASDRRRAIISNRSSPAVTQRPSSGWPRFINTSTWDIDLHNEIVDTGTFKHHIDSRQSGSSRSPFTFTRPLSTPWGALEVGDQILLSYYETVLSRIVTTIDDDRNGFRHVLIKMALSDASRSSAAVLQAILAFSAYHLSGSQAGVKHSFAAISALSSSMRSSTGVSDRHYQLAASLLLTVYGVGVVSCFARHSHFPWSFSAITSIHHRLATLGPLLLSLLHVLIVSRCSTPLNRNGQCSSVAPKRLPDPSLSARKIVMASWHSYLIGFMGKMLLADSAYYTGRRKT